MKHAIVGAPSKWDLAVSFFDNKVAGRQRPVTFSIEVEAERPISPKVKQDIHVTIYSLQWEDGSGESWLFEGFRVGGTKVNGWFRTTDRKGWIEV